MRERFMDNGTSEEVKIELIRLNTRGERISGQRLYNLQSNGSMGRKGT
jgi:hypothetical protein